MDSSIGRKDLDLQDNDNVELKKRLLGATTEIGPGIATDFGTSWMLGAGPWGWLGYGASNI